MTDFDLLTTLITITAVMAVVLGVVAYLVLLERKAAGWIQDRVGPNRVGPWGVFQPIADGLKMLLKEDIIPRHVDRLFFVLAPAVAAGTALFALAVVPFGPTTPAPLPAESVEALAEAEAAYQASHSFVIAPGLDIGILFVFAIGSLAVYGVVLGGWSANNKYTLLGSLRASAQIISYEIPLGMALLGVILLCGSLNFEQMIGWQASHGWFVAYQPLAFLLFLTSVFAETNRLPFDMPEAEQELVGGYHTEYSSMKFGLFFLGEYSHMVVASLILSIVFFGGWDLFGLTAQEGWLGYFLKFSVLFGKVFLFLLLYIFVRWTIPRFRFDQLMSLAWNGLIPLAMLNLFAVMIVLQLGWTPWLLTAISLLLFAGAAFFTTTGTPGRSVGPVTPTHSTPAGV